jgi:hypothetical protein
MAPTIMPVAPRGTGQHDQLSERDHADDDQQGAAERVPHVHPVVRPDELARHRHPETDHRHQDQRQDPGGLTADRQVVGHRGRRHADPGDRAGRGRPDGHGEGEDVEQLHPEDHDRVRQARVRPRGLRTEDQARTE